jgi:general secretion pathway protein G
VTGEITLKKSGIRILDLILWFIFFLLIGLLLFLFIAPRFYGDREATKWELTKPMMEPVKFAINAYYLNTGQYPGTLDDLLTPPKGLENVWEGPYLKDKQTFDLFGNRYIYEPNSVTTANYILISYGADGKSGGKGDNADIKVSGTATRIDRKLY